MTLKEMRQQAGFKTLEEGARAVDCSRIHLQGIERGLCGASMELVGRIMSAYHVGETTLRAALTRSRRGYLKRMSDKERHESKRTWKQGA